MPLYDGFFDSDYNDDTGEYDREYGPYDFTKYFGQVVGSGVCVTEDPDSCKVTLVGSRALVNTGYLFIRGYWLRVKDEPYAIDLTGTAPLAVAASLNTGKKMIELEAVPAAETYPPDTLVLAVVDPAVGTVRDTRYDTGICGVIDSAGGVSDKAAYAIDYINKEIGPKFKQIEADVAAQDAKMNEKIQEVGQVVEKIAPLPVGTIKFSAAQDMGEDWLRCDGRAVSREEYPELVDMLINFPDGNFQESTFNLSWQSGTLPSSATWVSVTYGNNKFVAVASDGKVVYSVDGIKWELATLPSFSIASNKWVSVTYGNGKFVAVASGNRNNAAYSTDGVIWNSTSIPDVGGYYMYWENVTYGDGKFVAVARGVQNNALSYVYASYSEDAINWKTIQMPSKSNWYSVTYGNDKFVAVAGDSDTAAYSIDGINWTAATLPSSDNWDSVTFGNGKFVAVAGDSTGGNKSAYSSDGINWTLVTLPYSADWKSVTYGNNKFVAVAHSSSRFSYAAPFNNARLPTLSLSNIPAYIKAKPDAGEAAV